MHFTCVMLPLCYAAFVLPCCVPILSFLTVILLVCRCHRYWQRCIFKYLRCEPEEHLFLLTEPPMCA